jgi:aspartate/methionine/tyrosine aminotransferase
MPRRSTDPKTTSPRAAPSSRSGATWSFPCSTRRTIECPVPDGAFYVYPSCAGATGKTTRSGTVLHNDEEFAAALLEEEGAAVVTAPPSAKGPTSGFLRNLQ